MQTLDDDEQNECDPYNLMPQLCSRNGQKTGYCNKPLKLFIEESLFGSVYDFAKFKE